MGGTGLASFAAGQQWHGASGLEQTQGAIRLTLKT